MIIDIIIAGEQENIAQSGNYFSCKSSVGSVRKTRGERSNSLKILTYVERVNIISSPPFFHSRLICNLAS